MKSLANVQKENGYTAIANEIIEQLVKRPLNGTQWRIVAVIWRYTYGFSRREHRISESFIVKATGISRRFVSSELAKLIEQRIIIVVMPSSFTESRVLSFNKDYDTWRGTKIQQGNNASSVEQKCTSTGEGLFHSTVEQSFHQENNYLKQNKYTCEFESFWKEYPRKVGKGDAFKVWKARIKEKCKPEDMIQAATNYAVECKKKGTETEYVKHPKTFLSKTKPYSDYLKTEENHNGKTENVRKDIIKAPEWFVEKAGGNSE